MISIKNVSKQFDQEKLLFKNMVFEEGKSYVILGPSGCGKSTLLGMLSGNLSPSEGNIEAYIKGKQYELHQLGKDELKAYRREHISYVSQSFSLFEEFTVGDNVDIMRQIKECAMSTLEVLKRVGLEEKIKQQVKTLSGGEKQRVCIARALMQQGSIMLCDEPTGSLNHRLAKDIVELLVQLHKENNTTLIVVTHDDRLIGYFDQVIQHEDLIGGVEL